MADPHFELAPHFFKRSRTEATFIYRRKVADAIVAYRARIRETWDRFGRPMPLSPECAECMIEAWVECRIAWRDADRELNNRRDR